MVIGFEPGLQAYTGVSGGVEHEKAMIAHLNGRWARMVLKRCSSERGEREKRFYLSLIHI